MKAEKLYKEDGSPRYVAVYECKRNSCVDKYTVVFTHANWLGDRYKGKVLYVGTDGLPYYPLGFYQHGEACAWQFNAGGSRIRWQDLPVGCRKAVMDDYHGLWETEGSVG